MRSFDRLTDAIIVALIFYFLAPVPAHAYFDLGMGTYMVQILFGFAAAFWFSFKHSMLKKFKPKNESRTEADGSVALEKTEE